MSEANQLVSQILQLAQSRGMDQKALAEAARISPETLSRLKKADDVYFSTLSQLAHAVGMKLSLSSDAPVADKINQGRLFQ